jgi:hypothetical protein
MGVYGPIPKRSDQRRRRNIPSTPIDHAAVTGAVNVPPGDPNWDKFAREWFESLVDSGQSAFYEPSDWAQARVWAELLSRALKQGERPSAVLIAAWSSGAGELLTTEGARRRMRIELERRPDRDADEERADATVTALRTRLEGR